MNDDDLVFAAYRLVLNMVIPPLRSHLNSQKAKDIKISWPCTHADSAGADWTVAAFYYKNRLAFAIWSADQHIFVGTRMAGRYHGVNIKFFQVVFKEPIADQQVHLKLLEFVINLILKYRKRELNT